jgi:ABC-type sugar transport system substrate-binding protein
MKTFRVLSVLLVIAMLLAACSPAATPTANQPAATQAPAEQPTAAPAQPTAAPVEQPTAAPAQPTAATGAKEIHLGYVLHGLNNFTQVIKQGAEDAGKALGVDVEVTGPASFVSTEAIGMFEGLIQKGKDGLVTVPQPGDVWVAPIKEATDAGIPVMTANVTSPGSTAAAWFGQDEYNSGVLLGQELRKILEGQGTTKGKIVVGTCVPGVDVLVSRYNGFVKGMEGSGFTISEAYDVTPENTSNYAAWENLASANPDMVAAVGLCSLDIPNLAQIKTRSNAKWTIGGYDLNVETLDAIKAGTAQITVGQNPYLQGYLPVLALYQNKCENKDLVKGWVDVGTEVVTAANVNELYDREKDPAKATAWYADWIKKNFTDLNAMAKPLP